ncbi:hypothetical protein GIB67_000534 [Kingdonia uniflora]|uniref:Uncharacterized protein n=1 Tax=Kingdonia uniflora TaxID=39325 RepID=A0A7J7MIN1_9MAGN|nr:hypothetical protein GIB67_000534 [Kingdonia uniflora]
MSSSIDKRWIKLRNPDINFLKGTNIFRKFAKKHLPDSETIHYPYSRCRNQVIPISYNDVVIDLMKHEFTETYTTWIYHGESEVTQGTDVAEHYFDDEYLRNLSTALNNSLDQENSVVPYSFHNTSETVELEKVASSKATGEDPAIEFSKVVHDTMNVLYPECKGFTVLAFVTILYKLKVKHNWGEISFTEFLQMQDNYGASGYFLETGGTNKRIHVESMKLTEVSASDKLKSFRASQELADRHPPAQRECTNAKSTEMIGFSRSAISVLNDAEFSSNEADNSSLIQMDVDQSFLSVSALVKAAIFESGTLCFSTGTNGNYVAAAKFLKENVVNIPTNISTGFKLTVDVLAELLQEVDKPWVYLSGPTINPTGLFYSNGEIQEILSVSTKYEARVVIDTSFSGLEFNIEGWGGWNLEESLLKLDLLPKSSFCVSLFGGLSIEMLTDRLAFGFLVFNKETFKWSFNILFSRLLSINMLLVLLSFLIQFFQKLKPSVQLPSLNERVALVPWVDMLNHSCEVFPIFEYYLLVFTTDRPYQPGELVFISYGKKSNGELLLSYGFVSKEGTNPSDSTNLSVSLNKTDVCCKEKLKVIRKHGLSASECFPIQIIGWPVELMAYAYLVVSPPTMAKQFEEVQYLNPLEWYKYLFVMNILRRRLRDMKIGKLRSLLIFNGFFKLFE